VIAELGHYALMLALGLALIQGIMPIVGTRSNDPTLISVAAPAALAQFSFVALAFGALATCYVTSDFSVVDVSVKKKVCMSGAPKERSRCNAHCT